MIDMKKVTDIALDKMLTAESEWHDAAENYCLHTTAVYQDADRRAEAVAWHDKMLAAYDVFAEARGIWCALDEEYEAAAKAKTAPGGPVSPIH